MADGVTADHINGPETIPVPEPAPRFERRRHFFEASEVESTLYISNRMSKRGRDEVDGFQSHMAMPLKNPHMNIVYGELLSVEPCSKSPIPSRSIQDSREPLPLQ